MTGERHCCAVVPSYDNPQTVRAVVEAVREHLPEVILVDDGSHAPGRAACAALASAGLARVIRHEGNRGKGAAVMSGLIHARELGFTHAFQVDADGQHDISALPGFLEASRLRPDALVLGHPVYDASVQRSRQMARRLTSFWVAVELGGRRTVTDAMIGFRVYPIAATLATQPRTRRMDFDIEVAVLMARAGVEVLNLPVAVRYLPAEQGGVSHFHPLRDNLRLAVMHTRLCMSGLLAWATGRFTRRSPGRLP